MARRKGKPSKEEVKRVMDEVDALDLPDGAYWGVVHDRLGLEYGDVFDYISAYPAFFDAQEVTREQAQRNR